MSVQVDVQEDGAVRVRFDDQSFGHSLAMRITIAQNGMDSADCCALLRGVADAIEAGMYSARGGGTGVSPSSTVA